MKKKIFRERYNKPELIKEEVKIEPKKPTKKKVGKK